MSHSGKSEKDLPKPVVGHGHPLDPNRGVLLSHDDERRIDEEGRPIAEGELWGNAKTGAYICIAVTQGEHMTSNKTLIGLKSTDKLLDGRRLNVWCSIGLPVLYVSCHGAALELPSDLGRDPTKQTYVTEWIAATAAEALVAAGVRHLAGDPILCNQCASWTMMNANEAINCLGL